MKTREIIIDCYTVFTPTLFNALKRLKWVEEISYGKYCLCPECSAVRMSVIGKTVEDVEKWLNSRKFKGFGLNESWIGVVSGDEVNWTPRGFDGDPKKGDNNDQI